ncbi:hypothetical protein N7540_002562 [Penicillium herquei]|nr:hypothetical protein N7540_002562 [Penicillium herquei]
MFQIAVYCVKAEKAPTVENLEWYRNQISNQRDSKWQPKTNMQNYLRRAGTQKGYRIVLRQPVATSTSTGMFSFAATWALYKQEPGG